MSFVEGLVIIVLILAITLTFWLIISRNSHQGKIIVEIDENDAVTYTLEFDGDPYDIKDLKNVSFKVVKKDENAN